MKNLQIPKRDESIREKMREFQTAESFKNPVYWLAEDYNKCPVLIPDMIREVAFWNLVNSILSTQKRRPSQGTRQF